MNKETQTFEDTVNEIFSLPEEQEAIEEKEVDTSEEEQEEVETEEEDEEQPTEEGDDGLQEEREGQEEVEASPEKKEKTNADYAHERIEKKRWEELIAENARLKAQQEMLARQQQQAQPQPKIEAPQNPFDKDIEPESHQLWEDNQKLKGDIASIQHQFSYQDLKTKKELAEVQTAQANPEYVSQKQFLLEKQSAIYEVQAFNKLRAEHPHATDEQINAYIQENKGYIQEKTKQEIDGILLEATMGNRKLDEVVSMYATHFGYTPKQKEQEETKPVADLKALNKNKSKSTSLNGKGLTSGKTSNKITGERINDMSFEEMLNVNINDIEF